MTEQQKDYFLSKTKQVPQQIQLLLGLRSQESLLVTVRAEQLGLIHPWQAPNTSIQYNGHDGELLLVGKLGINPELFDNDSPTFHIHKSRLGELIKEFREAKKKMISKCGIPEILTRLNYDQQNDCMMEEAFNRLSEKPKIFCAKQMNNLIDDMSEDLFIVHTNNSSAQRTKTKTRAGTSNMADAGTKTSSRTSVNNFNELLELQPGSITDINLATTK